MDGEEQKTTGAGAQRNDGGVKAGQGEGQQAQQGTDQGKGTAKNDVDVSAVKAQAVQSLLQGIGVSDEESLKGIIEEHRKQKESQMSDIEKKDAEITKLTKELVNERELRIMAEAKIQGIKLGANKDLIDDLVIIAKSKVTKDKDITVVLSEMKEAGAIYFKAEESQDVKPKGKAANATGLDLQGGAGKKKDDKADALLSGLFEKKERPKSRYFKN